MAAVALVLLSLIAVAAAWANRGLRERALLQAQLRELEQQALHFERRNDDLRRHLRRLRSDQDYLERFLRERIGWVKQGEILYRFPKAALRRKVAQSDVVADMPDIGEIETR